MHTPRHVKKDKPQDLAQQQCRVLRCRLGSSAGDQLRPDFGALAASADATAAGAGLAGNPGTDPYPTDLDLGLVQGASPEPPAGAGTGVLPDAEVSLPEEAAAAAEGQAGDVESLFTVPVAAAADGFAGPSAEPAAEARALGGSLAEPVLAAAGPRPAPAEEEESLRDALAPLVAGLRRTGKLPAALAAFKDSAVAEVKQAIRYTSWSNTSWLKPLSRPVLLIN